MGVGTRTPDVGIIPMTVLETVAIAAMRHPYCSFGYGYDPLLIIHHED